MLRFFWRLVTIRPTPSRRSVLSKNIATFQSRTITKGFADSSARGMDKIIIHGGHSLEGTVKISGSKNSALPILAATLLTKEACVIHKVPDLSDVHYMLQILNHLGA